MKMNEHFNDEPNAEMHANLADPGTEAEIGGTTQTYFGTRFDAFISYRRSDGSAIAKWLRQALLRYRLPGPLRSRQQMLQIYLDTVYERATDDFFERNVAPSLRASRFLIVLCTPDAIKPRADGSKNWLEREVELFDTLPQRTNIVVALARGAWDDPLPGRLRDRYPQAEIIDLRLASIRGVLRGTKWRRRHELVKIIAPLLDVKPSEMPLLHREEERRQRNRLLAITLASSAVVLVLMAALLFAMKGLTESRIQLALLGIAQARASADDQPSRARLHLANVAKLASTWPLPVAELAHAEQDARLWLGTWFDEVPPRVLWHDYEVRFATVSPDGRLLATATALETYFWELQSARLIGTASVGGPSSAHSAVFSPLTNRVAVFSHTNFKVQLYDTQTFNEVGSLVTAGPVGSVEFSPDGELVAAPGIGQVRFWRSGDGQAVDTLLTGDAIPDRAIFHPNGKWMLIVTDQNSLQLWDFRRHRLLWQRAVSERLNTPKIVHFSGDGHRLLHWDTPRSVVVLNAANGEVVTRANPCPSVTAAAISADSRRVAIGCGDGRVQLLDVNSGLLYGALMLHRARVTSAIFSADSHMVLTASEDNTARTWDALTGHPVDVPVQHAGPVRQAIFGPGQDHLITASDDWTVRISSRYARTGRIRAVSFARPVLSATLDPSGKRVVAVLPDGRGHILDAQSGAEVAAIEGEGLHRVAFSADSRELRAVSDDSLMRWDAARGNHIPDNATAGWKELMLTDDGRYALGINAAKRLSRYEISTGQIASAPRVQSDSASVYCASRDGRVALTWHPEQGVYTAWNLTPRGVERRIEPLFREQGPCFCSPNGRYLALQNDREEVGKDSIEVWDLQERNRLYELKGTPSVLLDLPFSSDETRFLVFDETVVRVIDTRTGIEVGPRLEHLTRVQSAIFARDAGRVLTVSKGRVQLWHVETGEPIGPAIMFEGELEKPEFSADGQCLLLVPDSAIYTINREKIPEPPQRWLYQLRLLNLIATSTDANRLMTNTELSTVMKLDPSGTVRGHSRAEWERQQQRAKADFAR